MGLPTEVRMSEKITSEVISRRSALSFLRLAALSLAATPAVLAVSDAEAQQTGTERRQERRTERTERRQERRTGRTERRTERREGRGERREERRKGRTERREERRGGTEEKK
jgi:Ni/Co efflux regulator RcnB